MSALGRINLLVTLFFVLVTLISLAVLLRQAGADVRRELQTAQLLVDHLADELRDGGRPLPAAAGGAGAAAACAVALARAGAGGRGSA